MKLFYTPTSPFARKVRIALHELQRAPPGRANSNGSLQGGDREA
jgi:glutathione S-transferase